MKWLNAVCLGAVVAVMSVAGVARAEKSFDDAAQGAKWVPSKKALAPLFWAFVTDCKRYKNTLAQRQCELISSARKRTITGKRFLVEAGRKAFLVGKWDAKTKKVSIGVRPCLACDTPIKVAGKTLYVLGDQAKVKADKGVVSVAPRYTSVRTFKTKKHADKWKADLMKRVRTQFIVEFPNQLKTWKGGGKNGLKVSIVGFRVYDPCDGRIVCASPTAKRERPDRGSCKGKSIVADTRHTKKPTPKVDELPYRLSPRQIARALRPAVRRARKCKDTYGMTGTATYTITISADGRIIGLKETGDFVDTPTGNCIAKEFKTVRFPKSKKPRTTVTYPVILQ